MSTEQLKAEIKLALAAAAEEAEKGNEDGKKTFHAGIAIFWDHDEISVPIIGIISGWILCKGLGRVTIGLITEAKNEYLQEISVK